MPQSVNSIMSTIRAADSITKHCGNFVSYYQRRPENGNRINAFAGFLHAGWFKR